VTGALAFTPREIVGELDRYIVGQAKAKRAVAVALRNRWRRLRVAPELRDEIAPKNIILVGSTGVGKTEIARRMAWLVRAPFVKVEASKFTEVGYVGRDVESIVRDLVENAVQLVRAEAMEEVRVRAAELAEERLVRVLSGRDTAPVPGAAPATLGSIFGALGLAHAGAPAASAAGAGAHAGSRGGAAFSEEEIALRDDLRKGKLDDRELEIDVVDQSNPLFGLVATPGGGEMEARLGELLQSLPGLRGRSRRRRVKVPEARAIFEAEEATKLLDMDRVTRDAVRRAEESGIVFIDEIDKIAGRQVGGHGPDVSREGVQRDLLPIVEGSTVSTKYGPVRTDHVLFIAAGAFHVARVQDLIPELQGRFPVRVHLDDLRKEDFVRILREPRNALTRQYEALLATEGVRLRFTDDAIDAIAEHAEQANARAENIGARRLHGILETLLEDVSFAASEMANAEVVIDGERVRRTLGPVLGDESLARYVL
jgi:ATP-dependent HslUV protease ATP-binding subunit HslU